MAVPKAEINRRYRERDPDRARQQARDGSRRWREKHREQFRARKRVTNAEQSEARVAYNRGVPQLVKRARWALAAAVKEGRLRKPESCERCGTKTPSRRLHGHHSDYSHPLSVTWLCTICHGAQHSTGA